MSLTTIINSKSDDTKLISLHAIELISLCDKIKMKFDVFFKICYYCFLYLLLLKCIYLATALNGPYDECTINKASNSNHNSFVLPIFTIQ